MNQAFLLGPFNGGYPALIGNDGKLYMQEGGNWQDLGGDWPLQSGNLSTGLFMIGWNSELYWSSRPNTSDAWSPWMGLGGHWPLQTIGYWSNPYAYTARIYLIGSDGGLYSNQRTYSSGFQGWVGLDGDWPVQNISMANSLYDSHFLLVGRNGFLHYSFGGTSWENTGLQVPPQKFAMVDDSEGLLNTFALDNARQLHHRRMLSSEGQHTPWQNLGGEWPRQNVSVAKNHDGRLEVFLIGDNGQLYHRWQVEPLGAFNNSWESLGGSWPVQDVTVKRRDGHLEVYLIGQDGKLYQRSQAAPGSAWESSWKSRGGDWSLQPISFQLSTYSNWLGNLITEWSVTLIGRNHELYTRLQHADGTWEPNWFSHSGDWRRYQVEPSILLQHEAGRQLAWWRMNREHVVEGLPASSAVPEAGWRAVGSGDYNGDSNADILFQNESTRQLSIWLMDGSQLLFALPPVAAVPDDARWKAVGSGDFDGNRRADVLFQHETTRALAVWLMNQDTVDGAQPPVTAVPGVGWRAVGSGDFDGNGKADVLLQNETTRELAVWLMNGGILAEVLPAVTTVPGVGWKVVGSTDFNNDRKADVLFQHETTGELAIWLMNGGTLVEVLPAVNTVPGAGWKAVDAF